ncbi:alpha-N-acetylgalactosamine-specific lectin-like [Patiria miniata]|uniref:C-type lectin domain-containing protein n=1 Tax=Patiria miniata TaxID=46514 RepID=A0A914B545_PATMI|nr:alpha-N-acetylgalactosamine-specific lectin-like [Patiria miniata]
MKNCKLISVVTLLFMGLSLKTSDTYCPCHPPWVAFNQECYLIVMQKMSYQDAEEHCLTYSRALRECHLASVANDEEYDFILGLAVAASVDTSGLWLGLNDRLNALDFVWTDGSTSSYRRWNAPNQPDNNNNCGRTSANHDYKMSDATCSTKLASVCKVRQRNV